MFWVTNMFETLTCFVHVVIERLPTSYVEQSTIQISIMIRLFSLGGGNLVKNRNIINDEFLKAVVFIHLLVG